MARKGQKYRSYSEALKRQAVEMRMQGMTKKQVAEALGIGDITRLKEWMRKYRQQGEFGLLDRRGRRHQYVDRERYIRKLELENDVLKKWLEISNREGCKPNTK
jgi:transposase-like protein